MQITKASTSEYAGCRLRIKLPWPSPTQQQQPSPKRIKLVNTHGPAAATLTPSKSTSRTFSAQLLPARPDSHEDHDHPPKRIKLVNTLGPWQMDLLLSQQWRRSLFLSILMMAACGKHSATRLVLSDTVLFLSCTSLPCPKNGFPCPKWPLIIPCNDEYTSTTIFRRRRARSTTKRRSKAIVEKPQLAGPWPFAEKHEKVERRAARIAEKIRQCGGRSAKKPLTLPRCYRPSFKPCIGNLAPSSRRGRRRRRRRRARLRTCTCSY